MFLVAVAVVPFVLLTVLVSLSEHISPFTVIFGPGPGNPLITWLYYTVPTAAFQGLAGLALRHSTPGVRVAGVVGTLAVAAAALAWLGAMVYSGVQWLVTGALPGDFGDLLGIVFFGVPVLLVIALLNGRAALLGTHDVLGYRATSAHRLS